MPMDLRPISRLNARRKEKEGEGRRRKEKEGEGRRRKEEDKEGEGRRLKDGLKVCIKRIFSQSSLCNASRS